MEIIGLSFSFIFGLCVGSFLNVCIYRIPNNLSIIKPDSFCPRCQTAIKWYHNIPVLSYIFLRGKCAYCGQKISLEYPLIELVTGILTSIFFLKWHFLPFWFLFSIIACYLLIAVSVIDFKTMLISDFFSYSIAIIGLIASQFNPNFYGDWYQRLLNSLSGIFFGAGFIWFLAFVGKLIYKKDAVGDGDMFLLGAIGSFMGYKGLISVIIIASFIGSLYGVGLIIAKKADRVSYMPFGPFLALGCIVNLYNYWDFIAFISS
ncbi:MAG: prepilin peptidase [Elusimicrobia bacterium]|nr:prepilin peptidase [Elusimicrobiota bacterium]